MTTVRLQPIGNFKMATVGFSSSSSSCHDRHRTRNSPRPAQQRAVGGRGGGGTTRFLLRSANGALCNTSIHNSTTAGVGFYFSYLGFFPEEILGFVVESPKPGKSAPVPLYENCKHMLSTQKNTHRHNDITRWQHGKSNRPRNGRCKKKRGD